MHAEMKIPLTTWSLTAFLMALIAGFTDVLSFIGVNQLFTAHITGNVVIAIAEIIQHNPAFVPKIIAIPFFVLFAMVMTGMLETHGKTPKLLMGCLIVEALLLVVFMLGGVYLLPHIALDSKEYLGISMVAVSAMAVHNTLLRTYMTQFPPCTVMTGNITQFTVDLVTHLLNKTVKAKKHATGRGHELKRYGNVLLGFILGGIFAAFGYYWTGFWSTLLPILILFVMSLKAS